MKEDKDLDYLNKKIKNNYSIPHEIEEWINKINSPYSTPHKTMKLSTNF